MSYPTPMDIAESEDRESDLSPSERLANLCTALEEDLNESPFTREEWDRLDAERLELLKANDALAARLAEEIENAATYKQERDEIFVNYETVAAQLTEAHRQNADLMAIIDKRDEALGFIPLDKGMDMMDELREAKARLAEVERFLEPTGWQAAQDEHNALRDRLVEAVSVVSDLTRQITEFVEREGEADFYTGVAVEFLKKQTPCNHVWAKRLRGRDTCAICGVARPADSASLEQP